MIHRILPTAAALALLSLSACGQSQPEEVDSRAPDPLAEQLKNAAPVELPPAVKASVTFRCQPGNSLIYVDFFDGEKQANLRTEKGGTVTQLTAPASGQPYTGGGYTVKGTPAAVDYTAPGKDTLSCKA
jgi:predicted small lipoprotein YifL